MPKHLPLGTSAELEINKRLHDNPLWADDVRVVSVPVEEESIWGAVTLLVRAYEERYKKYMPGWKRHLRSIRSEYGLATEGDLRKAGFRHQLEIPMFPDLVTGEPDSLGYHLELIDKDILHKREYIREFCKRFPEFMVPEQL